MHAKILRVLCILLLILLAFVVGISVGISKKPTIIDGAKQIVIDFMHQPQAADMRNVNFYPAGVSMSRKVVGDVCGEVFTFKDELPYKYKRFIVMVSSSNDGERMFSNPLFDFEGESISEEDFQKIWYEKCK
ncbi:MULTISPECIES: hypothetical protein [unclassified Providencia]|uniref:hypothetical protein n=1 Tax=unclassified Providencia TaxID=2633465 RepID=UPI0012B62A92|nr:MULTISPECIES: hypothetical protein [unclassified Providencia]MTC77925.1 hypothetical protein [Providencia sp. wls1916]